MKRPKHLDRDARILPDKPNQTSVYDRAVFQRGENARWAKEMEKRNSEAMDALPAEIKFDSYGDLREPLGHTLDIIAGARRLLLGEGT